MTKEQIAVVEKARNTLLRDSMKAVSLHQQIEMNELASALTALLQHVRENEWVVIRSVEDLPKEDGEIWLTYRDGKSLNSIRYCREFFDLHAAAAEGVVSTYSAWMWKREPKPYNPTEENNNER